MQTKQLTHSLNQTVAVSKPTLCRNSLATFRSMMNGGCFPGVCCGVRQSVCQSAVSGRWSISAGHRSSPAAVILLLALLHVLTWIVVIQSAL